MPSSTFRMKVESSTTRTRNFLLVVAIVRLRYRGDRARRLRSYKLFDGRDQLIFLNRLGQKCRGAFLDRTISMLCPRARRDDHHGNSPRRWALAQLPSSLAQRFAPHWRWLVWPDVRSVPLQPYGSNRSVE